MSNFESVTVPIPDKPVAPAPTPAPPAAPPATPAAPAAAPAAPAPAPVPPATPAPVTPPANPVSALMDRATEALRTSGKLDDAFYKDAETAGLSREIVDTYVAGFTARAESVFSIVGGKQEYEKIVEFARTGGMTADEIKAYDSALERGDMAAIGLVLTGLKAKYVSKHGQPAVATVNGSPAPAVQPLGRAEMIRTMASARYQNDPQYRNEIAARLAVTDMNNQPE